MMVIIRKKYKRIVTSTNNILLPADENISTSPDAKKLKDSNSCDLDSEADEAIAALDKIGTDLRTTESIHWKG